MMLWVTISAVALALCVGGIFIFNRLIRLRFLMREANSGIDVQLKRRHDLIPNIVSAVKGYLRYEQNLLQDITTIRARLLEGSDPLAKKELEKSLALGLKSIFALAEAYPDLKANQSFLDLQKTLAEVEDQLQLARRYYNGTVRDYNILVESFPSNGIAALCNFGLADFFEIEYATERKVPDVKF